MKLLFSHDFSSFCFSLWDTLFKSPTLIENFHVELEFITFIFWLLSRCCQHEMGTPSHWAVLSAFATLAAVLPTVSVPVHQWRAVDNGSCLRAPASGGVFESSPGDQRERLLFQHYQGIPVYSA